MTDSQSASTPSALDTAAERRSLWIELRDAIRGTNADYTRIPLRRAVFLLAVPMVLELVLESTFAVVDIFRIAEGRIAEHWDVMQPITDGAKNDNGRF